MLFLLSLSFRTNKSAGDRRCLEPHTPNPPSYAVVRAHLTLKLQSLILRASVGPGCDTVSTSVDISDWVDAFWSAIP
jgi:hypothetical protein